MLGDALAGGFIISSVYMNFNFANVPINNTEVTWRCYQFISLDLKIDWFLPCHELCL